MHYVGGKRLVLVVHDETAVHVSGFLSEECGLLEVTQEELEAHHEGIPEARHLALSGALKVTVKIKIGAAHKAQWHPSGCWCGDDVRIIPA